MISICENIPLLEHKTKIKSVKSGQLLQAEKIGDTKIRTVVGESEIPTYSN